jgi:hypothetical protein
MGGDGGDLGGDDVGFWRAEAQRWRAQAERSGAEAAQLRDRVVELEGQVGALTEKVAELARLAFGKSSEKTSARQTAEQTAGEGGPDGAGAGQQAGRPPGRGRGQRKGSRGHGRRDYSHLPTREEIHDVPDGERVCPRCGADYVCWSQYHRWRAAGNRASGRPRSGCRSRSGSGRRITAAAGSRRCAVLRRTARVGQGCGRGHSRYPA